MEADQRFGWKERRAREFIATLKSLRTCDGKPAVDECQNGHQKVFVLGGEPVAQDPAPALRDLGI